MLCAIAATQRSAVGATAPLSPCQHAAGGHSVKEKGFPLRWGWGGWCTGESRNSFL